MSSNNLFDPDLSEKVELKSQGSWPEARHRFEPRSVHAVEAAIASERPLLVRGSPGVGKSQLARAVAKKLKVPFLPYVVHERSERDELFYSFDAVARLAQAQVSALAAQADKDAEGNVKVERSGDDWQSKLAEENFFQPGVLWWAFNWEEASDQAKRFSKSCRQCNEPEVPTEFHWTPTADRVCGPVVLIDEIDKADPSVPNGLLECMGNPGFHSAPLGKTIGPAKGRKPPLVIITTNEDRELPAAFLRRCLVLHMHFPSNEVEAKRFLLDDQARVFYEPDEVSDEICKQVAEELLNARKEAHRDGTAVPSAAEYLDILRILVKLRPGKDHEQREALARISDFALRKNRELSR